MLFLCLWFIFPCFIFLFLGCGVRFRVICLTEEEYRRLLRGELRLRVKPRLCFKRFRISYRELKRVLGERSGC